MAVIVITYNEGGEPTLGYKCITLSLMDNTKKVFDSGDFVKDWYQLCKYINTSDINEPLMYSSSVDHFITDGAPYHSGYLHIIEGKPVLKYPERESEYWYLNTDFEGLEIFVPVGTEPTWGEYVKLYSV
jgi:hypothetical protein